MRLLIALAALSSIAIAAKPMRRDLPAGWPWDTIPQVADGANWKTTFILVNLDSVESKYKLDFHGDDGTARSFQLVGLGARSSVSGTIAGRGTVTIETAGTSATLNQGWADLDLIGTDNVGIMAIFGTQGIPGRPDYEATVIGATGVDYEGVLPFDNMNGFVTSMAILNPSDFTESVVTVKITDSTGATLRTETLRLAAGRKIAFATTDRWPETRNRRGGIHFDSTSIQPLSVLGLRFHPGGAFTTVAFMDK